MKRALALVCLVGCAGLPHPDQADAERVAGTYPNVTLASLEQGRTKFVNLCSGCHDLPSPTRKTPAEWPHIVRQMGVKMERTPQADLDLIEQFLVAMSGRTVSNTK